MNNMAVGVMTGAAVGLSKFVADAVTGTAHLELGSILAIVVPVSGFGWYLSARLTRIEDAVKNLDCMRCPQARDHKKDSNE